MDGYGVGECRGLVLADVRRRLENASRWPSRGVYESVASRPRSVFAQAPPLRCARMATLVHATPAPVATSGRSRTDAWSRGFGPAPGTAGRGHRPHRRRRPRCAERPGRLVAHTARRLDHRSPPDPRRRTVRVHGVRQSAGCARVAVRDHLAALAATGGLLLVTVLMGLVAWSALLASVLRGRIRGAGPVVLALGLVLGARVAEPVLGTRPQVFTFALICWTLWIAETYCAPAAGASGCCLPLPAVGEPPRGIHRGHRPRADRRRRRSGQAPMVDRHRRSPTPDRGLGVALGASALAACVNPTGRGSSSSPRQREAPSARRASSSGNRRISPTRRVGAPRAAAYLRGAHGRRPCPAVVAPSLRPSRFRARAGRRGARTHVGAQHRHLCRGDDAAVDGDGRRSGAVATKPPRREGSRPPGWTRRAGHGRRADRSGRPRGRRGRRAGAQSASPGDRRRIPRLRDRAARSEPGPTAGVHRVWDRWVCHLPALAARVGLRVRRVDLAWHGRLRRLRSHRGRSHNSPTALELLASSNTTAVLYSKGALTDELSAAPGWTQVADDHGMLLYCVAMHHGHTTPPARRPSTVDVTSGDVPQGVRSSAMRLIGVTGGIATGKSTVDRMLRLTAQR